VPNWIAGRAVEPDRAAWHGRVPRASLDDARAAVAAAQASARAADIAAWAARVRAELALPSAAYAALGLDADERLRLAELERARFDAPLPSIEAPAIAWLALRWNELGAAPLARARALLEGGRAVVLAPDPRWPDAADLAARAWVELGLPGGQLQVLHGIERGDRERHWPAQLGVAAVTPLAAAETQLGASLDDCVGRVRALSGQFAGRPACLAFDARDYADAIERVRAELPLALPELDPPPHRERERMEALLRRCGAVRVPTRANRPALYVNLDGPLDALAELPPGPWLCLRRNS
jgi:hypothetical protein